MAMAERWDASRGADAEGLSLFAYLRPLLAGKRVLEAPRAAFSDRLRVLGADPAPLPDGGALDRARTILGEGSLDWILWNGDLGALVEGWESLAPLLAPEGHLLFSLGPESSEAGRTARYREAVEVLSERFPSVQVLIRYGLRAEVVAPVGGPQAVRVEAAFATDPDEVAYAFVCGRLPARLPAEQRLVALPGEEPPAAASPAEESHEPPAVEEEEAAEAAEEEAEAAGAEEERELVRLRRKLGDARERAELAELRADEAEQRLREAERRADRAEAERSELAVALRRLEHELEMARRNNEALATSIATGKPPSPSRSSGIGEA